MYMTSETLLDCGAAYLPKLMIFVVVVAAEK
jgi:hypothetical protein